MCGIVGFLGGELSTDKIRQETLKKMSDQVLSRGPDSSGSWTDPLGEIGLAHRRLAIVDLSSAGHQPMISGSNRYVITYNGEIYNSLDIKEELIKNDCAPAWRGHSDTEILLAGFDAWGIKDTISRLTGMFAIAIWDKDLKQLTLVRDRVGEKPLYYGWQGSGSNKVFLFGSELKSLKMHPQFSNEIDRGSLALYMRYCYVPTPHSIYKGIKKLEPGTILTVSLNHNDSQEKYWDACEVAKKGFESPFDGTVTEVTKNLEAALKKTISKQMVADVPLGAFLSGGIDSSTVVALMQTQSSRAIKTFTIGFKEDGYNEAEFANLVATHIGTDHTELYVSSQDALDVVPNLPNLYCEPFADSSQIPTFLVSALARQHVTVSLSGDGGDEIFCGYNRYLFADKLWKGLKNTPPALRELVGKSVQNFPDSVWRKTFKFLNTVTPSKFNGVILGDKLKKGANVLASKDITSLYQGLVSD